MTDQKKTLKDYGVKDGDMVMMDRIRRQQRPAPAPGSGGGGFNFKFRFLATFEVVLVVGLDLVNQDHNLKLGMKMI